MSENARSSPRWAFRRTPRSGWGSDKWPEYSAGIVDEWQPRMRCARDRLPSSPAAARARAARGGRREIGELAALRERALGSVTTSGTGFVVCAVCGLTPSASSICSALPWSAVTRQTPPAACAASTTPAEARVGRLDRRDDGRDRARVADHVRVREVDDREAVAVADLGRRSASATSRGRHLRLVVVARHVARARDEDPRLARPLLSTPPLKKYVTCAYFSVSATCSWRAPCAREHLGERLARRPARANTTGHVEVRRGSASSSSGRRPPRAAAARAGAPGRGGS